MFGRKSARRPSGIDGSLIDESQAAEGRLRAVLSLAVVVALALVATACGGDYPRSTIDPVTGDLGGPVQSLYELIFWITMVILAIVWGVLGYVIIRFRDRGDDREPSTTRGNLLLEIGWTLIPAAIVVALMIPSVRVVFETQEPAPEDALVVDVVGHQWWWEFRYPEEGIVTANELHLPVGRPVELRLSSADVIHSFWVPRLGGKRDVNPLVTTPEGKTGVNRLKFTIDEAGTYTGQCAEFCGSSHALMGVRVVAESPEEYRAWVGEMKDPVDPLEAARSGAAGGTADSAMADTAMAGRAAAADTAMAERAAAAGELAAPAADTALIARGKQVFMSRACIACHTIEGTTARGVLGPSLTRIGAREMIGADLIENSPENLKRWILHPEELKPGVKMPGAGDPGGGMAPTGLTEEEAEAVAAYLWSLK